MKNKSITFNRKQYRTLLKILFLGEWMYQAHSTEEDPDVTEIEQKIFSFFESFNADDWIEYDDKNNRWFPTIEMEESIFDSIDSYDEFTFWDELAHRLAARDFIKKYGEKKISKMTIEEKIEKEYPFIEKYMDEFEENGLTNLIVNKMHVT